MGIRLWYEWYLLTQIGSYIYQNNFSKCFLLNRSTFTHFFFLLMFAFEFQIVGPKKLKLKDAEEMLSETMSMLKSKQEELATAEQKLRDLEQQLDEMKARKKELELQVEACATKLQRAEQLIGGLGGEKSRWQEIADDLQRAHDNLCGDILICSAVIAYLGPFTSTFRSSCIADWVRFVSSRGVACTTEFDIGAVLGSPMVIREWHMNGLPFDDFSVENAAIIHNSFKWFV